jgi:hypothetical protein
LALYSRDFANAYWTKEKTTVVTDSAVGLDGNADLVHPNANGTADFEVALTRFTGGLASETRTVSYYIKPSGWQWVYVLDPSGAFRVWFDLQNGVLGTQQGTSFGKITAQPDGWYRIEVFRNQASTSFYSWFGFSDADNSTVCTANGTDGVLLDFAQVESGSVATSPIPTVASTATRTADSVSLTGASSLIGQTEGTLYVEHQPILLEGLVSRQIIGVSDNTFDNYARLQYQAFGSPFRYRLVSTVRQGASNLYELAEGNAGGLTTGNVEKIAFAYKDADYATYRNGVAVVGAVTGTGALTSIASSEIDLGQAHDNTRQLNGWIRYVVLYPTRLSNAELASLTA